MILLPINYLGWVLIILAFLRFNNKAVINDRWKLAFSSFIILYSLGELSVAYFSYDLANVFYLLSGGTFLLPFLKIDYNKYIDDVERVSETELLIGFGIIVLLS